MTLAKLIERVEGLKAGDREVDALLSELVTGIKPYRARTDEDPARLEHADPNIPHRFIRTPDYTTSLDAAVAFVEAALPGWWWEINGDRQGGFKAATEGPNAGDAYAGDAYADSGDERKPEPALALVLAALKALEGVG